MFYIVLSKLVLQKYCYLQLKCSEVISVFVLWSVHWQIWVSHFRLSPLLIIDVNSILGLLTPCECDSADFSEVHDASMYMYIVSCLKKNNQSPPFLLVPFVFWNRILYLHRILTHSAQKIKAAYISVMPATLPISTWCNNWRM